MTAPLPSFPRFRLRTLMAATAATALAFWLFLFVPTPLVFVIFAGVAFLILPWVIRRGQDDPMRPLDRVLFPAVVAAAVAGEWFASRLAYHTMGEIDRGMYVLAIALNVPAFGLIRRRRRWAYGWVVTLALLTIPYQLVLLGKWTLLDREARNVVAFAIAQKDRTGDYPADLSGYVPAYPLLFDAIRYEASEGGQFALWYHLGSDFTHHTFTPSSGWFYHPD